MEPPLKFQQLNSKLSHMKHFPEVSKSDLQLVKILLGHFLGMCSESSCCIFTMEVNGGVINKSPFPLQKIGDFFSCCWNKY